MSEYDLELSTALKGHHVDFSIPNISADSFFDMLNEKFPVRGTQIDWSSISLLYRKLHDSSLKSDFDSCIEIIRSRYFFGVNDYPIIYIGDSLTDFAYEFSFKEIGCFFSIASEIPQHHYFMDYKAKWCLSVTMTNDLNFGYSIEDRIKIR